jgi:RimJ/RimL family protein N-acetyltransferase
MITLKTHANNRSAIALYRKLGFKKAGVMPQDVRRRRKPGFDDTLLMFLMIR